MNSYEKPERAQKYLDYLDSADGRFQQEILSAVIFESLNNGSRIRVRDDTRILDAACGTGWLAYELSKKFEHVQGFDNSEFLLNHGKKLHPELNLAKADLMSELPYPSDYFDVIIVNMAASDVSDLEKLYINLARVLKSDGTLIVTIPNPSYAFPIGVWKRGLVRWLFRRKPILKLRPWSKFSVGKNLSWKKTFSGYFYPVSEQTKNAKRAGLALDTISELRSEKDNDEFNLQYQSFRYPLFILLEYKKRSTS